MTRFEESRRPNPESRGERKSLGRSQSAARKLPQRTPRRLVLGEIRLRLHHPLRPREDAGQIRNLRRADLPHPVEPAFLSGGVQDRAAPGLGVELEETLRAQPRLVEEMVHVVLEPRLPLENRRELLEKVRAG